MCDMFDDVCILEERRACRDKTSELLEQRVKESFKLLVPWRLTARLLNVLFQFMN